MRDAIRHGVETLRSLEASLGLNAKADKILRLASDISDKTKDPEIQRLAESIIGEL